MSYDTKCAELARHFLSDTAQAGDETLVGELAQTIQEVVEVWFQMKGLTT